MDINWYQAVATAVIAAAPNLASVIIGAKYSKRNIKLQYKIEWNRQFDNAKNVILSDDHFKGQFAMEQIYILKKSSLADKEDITVVDNFIKKYYEQLEKRTRREDEN